MAGLIIALQPAYDCIIVYKKTESCMLERGTPDKTSPQCDILGGLASEVRGEAGVKSKHYYYSVWLDSTSIISQHQNPFDSKCFPSILKVVLKGFISPHTELIIG